MKVALQESRVDPLRGSRRGALARFLPELLRIGAAAGVDELHENFGDARPDALDRLQPAGGTEGREVGLEPVQGGRGVAISPGAEGLFGVVLEPVGDLGQHGGGFC